MLNKNGWGLKEMLFLSSILLIFLAISIYYIVSMYNNFAKEIQATDYSLLEEKLEKQALIYLNDYYDDNLTNEEITITRNVLRTFNLDIILEDNKGNSCSGYVKANKTHGKIHAKSFIKCNDYITEGYEGWINEKE